MAIKRGWQIDSVSKSDLTTFDMCGEKYRHQKLLGEYPPMGWAGIRGTAVHKAVEVNSKNKIEKGDDLKLQQLLDAFDTSWAEQAKKRADGVKATGWDPDMPAPGKEPKKEEDLKVEGRGFVEVYHTKAAPILMPTASETNFEIPLEINGKKVRVRGIIDWMGHEILDWEARKLGEGVSILDFKTTDEKPKSVAWRSFELVLYAMALQHVAGELPSQVGLFNLVKTKSETYTYLDAFQPKQQQVDRLKQRITAFFTAVNAEAFHPASLMFGAWWCDKRFCGFWENCKLRPE